jgi:phosphomannomutase
MAGAFADGATEAGAHVLLVGLASTDQLYFASGHLGHPGVMFTASHNPAQYNGIKMCRANAVPIGVDTGLAEIRDAVAAGDTPVAARQGTISHHDVLDAYAAHLLSLAPVAGRRLKVVVDAGNGMAGHTAPAVFDRLGDDRVELVPMYFELDGTFPNHEANPIDPDTLVDLQARVVAERADIGLAFDGDADRCFLVDEQGRAVSPSTLTALIASRELAKEPGATVIHNLITSRAVPELVSELGGVAVRTRVGHSYIKATMAETDAVFGGEHSGHFYFRDFWRADSGMLAALHALAALAEADRPLSELLGGYERYVVSGEINSTVDDQGEVMAEIERVYAGRDATTTDHLDGLTVTHEDWWFNVRPSNTEPLLRLNAEGRDAATMAEVRDSVLTLIRRDR